MYRKNKNQNLSRDSERERRRSPRKTRTAQIRFRRGFHAKVSTRATPNHSRWRDVTGDTTDSNLIVLGIELCSMGFDPPSPTHSPPFAIEQWVSAKIALNGGTPTQ